jgi:release factor glutamine methyltransferase
VISIDDLISGSGLPAAEASALLGHVLQQGRAWIIAHGKEPIDEGPARDIAALLARRSAGEPLAYITGEREFYGLTLKVNASVLIPRPETELVVERVLALVAGCAVPRILDLGTGSGAIAAAVAHALPDAEVWACDASPEALAVASANFARHGVVVRLVNGNWFSELGGECFDVIASNPPYVADADPHLAEGDLRFEPAVALVAGADGLDCIRAIASSARRHLRRGGWLVVEHGYDHGPACTQLLTGLGYTAVSDACDLSGLARVCSGKIDAAFAAA